MIPSVPSSQSLANFNLSGFSIYINSNYFSVPSAYTIDLVKLLWHLVDRYLVQDATALMI